MTYDFRVSIAPPNPSRSYGGGDNINQGNQQMTINTDDLTIKQARELAAQFCNTPIAAVAPDTSGGVNRPVIVRSRDAGVQFGYLDHFEGSTVYLRNARQMWSWTALKGGTLLDCATQ